MKIVIGRLSALFLTLFLVVANAVLIETLLDMYGISGHRLFTGFLGTSLIILSFGYSLRKRKKLITSGRIKGWLFAHEWLSIAGSFIIFIHTGTHLNAVVPLITLVFMFTAFVSGLIGRYVYERARSSLRMQRERLKESGLPESDIEQRLWALAITSEALSKWRAVHKPIVSILAVMVLYHAVSALYYGGF
ncbi:MAG: hypothetical protein GXP46_12500 [Deferribacteres bacterium]|nr:hypothetical protein [Deferribacteres bacterium]